MISRVAAAIAITAAPGLSQAPDHGTLVFGSYGAFVYDAAWASVSSTVGEVVARPELDDRGYLYGTSRGQIVEVSPSILGWMGPWRGSYPTLNSLDFYAYSRAFVTRDTVWIADAGQLGRLSKGISGQSVSWVYSIPVVTNASGESIIEGAVDGRSLVYCTMGRTGIPAEVYCVDLITGLVSHLLSVSGPSTRPRSICFAEDGKVLIHDQSNLIEIDIESGSNRVISSGAPAVWSDMEHDPWTGKIKLAALTGQGTVFEYDMATSVWTQPIFHPIFLGSIAGGLAAIVVRPFEHFGHGCVNGLNLEPRLGWTGLPLQGTSFSVDVRDTEPNAFVAFWLGISDQFWAGVGSLPFDATGLGAPGCKMYASAEDWFPALADANGDASVSFSVPVNPSLHGLEFFMQSASTSSANALGMAASDALVIRVR